MQVSKSILILSLSIFFTVVIQTFAAAEGGYVSRFDGKT